jgi:hypothetical protein
MDHDIAGQRVGIEAAIIVPRVLALAHDHF